MTRGTSAPKVGPPSRRCRHGAPESARPERGARFRKARGVAAGAYTKRALSGRHPRGLAGGARTSSVTGQPPGALQRSGSSFSEDGKKETAGPDAAIPGTMTHVWSDVRAMV